MKKYCLPTAIIPVYLLNGTLWKPTPHSAFNCTKITAFIYMAKSYSTWPLKVKVEFTIPMSLVTC